VECCVAGVWALADSTLVSSCSVGRASSISALDWAAFWSAVKDWSPTVDVSGDFCCDPCMCVGGDELCFKYFYF